MEKINPPTSAESDELQRTAEIAFYAMNELRKRQEEILQKEKILEQQRSELLVLQEEMKNTANIAFNSMRDLGLKNLELENTKRHLQVQAEMLKVSHQEMEQITYMAAHDLKAPINNIESTLYLIRKKMEFDSVSEFLGWIDRSIEQAKTTLEDLNQLVYIKKTGQESFEDVDLKQLIGEVTSSLASGLGQGEVEISVSMEEAPIIFFSPVLLKSVFQNVIGNAIKYRSMERKSWVKIEGKLKGDKVLVSVVDNGIGLDLDKHGQELFQMFKRFHNHVDGSGIGLYLVGKIVERANGEITLESQVGEGTTIRMVFPLKPTG